MAQSDRSSAVARGWPPLVSCRPVASLAAGGVPAAPHAHIGAVPACRTSITVALEALDAVPSFAGVLTASPTALALAYTLDLPRETFDDDRSLVAIWVEPDSDSTAR